MTNLFAVVFLVGVFRFIVRSAPRRQTFMPLDREQRRFQFHTRLDAEVGLHTEEYEAMLARGIAAKRKMLAHCRNRVHVEKTPDWLLFGMERIGDGPLTRVRLRATPLKSLAKAGPVITVRKQRLSLAR